MAERPTSTTKKAAKKAAPTPKRAAASASSSARAKKPAAKKQAAKKSAAKKSAAKKPVTKKTAAKKTPTKKKPPSGRDEIMAAIIDAATTLLAQEPLAQISVRDIAERAGVGHSVVFRYFGNKEAVLQAVIAQREHDVTRWFDDEGLAGVYRRTLRSRTVIDVMAQSIVGGTAVAELRSPAFVTTYLADKLRERWCADGVDVNAREAKLMAASLEALLLGWVFFEDFLMTEIDVAPADRPAARDEIAALVERLAQRPPR